MLTVPTLTARLLALASPLQKAQAEAYFKGAVPFLGVKGPAVDAVFKAARPELAAMGVPARFELALLLFDAEPAEVRHLGVLLLNLEQRRLPADWMQRCQPLVERRATNWGTADAWAGRVMRYRLPNEDDRRRLVEWSTCANPWLRRIACVAFVNEARKGHYADEIRVVVEGALGLDHRFAQLGAGWLLRERWLAAPEEVESFLRSEGRRMHREAVRYAVEKMPPGLRADLMAATK